VTSPSDRADIRAGRPLFFYSYWELGYHSPEAERKAIALSEAGYRVVHVTGVGIRNPTLSTAWKAIGRLVEKLRHRSAPRESALHPNLSTASVLVFPPRQFRLMRRINAWWLRRQLLASMEGWSEAIAWIRFPSPELVDALATLHPHKVIYECVDPYDDNPLTQGVFRRMLQQAERDLVERSDLIVVPTEALAERFRSRGPEVRVIPHGVDLDLFAWPPVARSSDGPVTIGFIGTLDFRLDLTVLRHLAGRHPEWRIRLIGQLGDIFDPASLGDLSNVSVEPAIPHERIGEVIAGFSAGIMPYVEWPGYRYTVPVKNLELMAAGKPGVARPSPALEPYAGLVYFATEPDQYRVELERALAEDSDELRQRRRETAEANTWRLRLAEIQQAAEDLAPPA
jgi:teichuronic acid biosynthesis glycosyltransferase TuaH